MSTRPVAPVTFLAPVPAKPRKVRRSLPMQPRRVNVDGERMFVFGAPAGARFTRG